MPTRAIGRALRAAFEGCDVVALAAPGRFSSSGSGRCGRRDRSRARTTSTRAASRRGSGSSTSEVEAPIGVLVPAFGFDYVPGDLAARLAAEQVEGPLDEIVVAYSVKGVGTSRGTRRTIGHVMGQKQVAWEDGRLVPSRFGETTRTRALSVRRANGRRVGRDRAAHGAAPHRCPQRALVHPRAGRRGQGGRPRPAGGALRPRRARASARAGPSEAVAAARAVSRSSPRRAAPAAKGAPWSRGATSTASPRA